MDIPYSAVRPPVVPDLFYLRWSNFVKTIEAAGVFDTPTKTEPTDTIPLRTPELKEFRSHNGLRRRPRRLQ